MICLIFRISNITILGLDQDFQPSVVKRFLERFLLRMLDHISVSSSILKFRFIRNPSWAAEILSCSRFTKFISSCNNFDHERSFVSVNSDVKILQTPPGGHLLPPLNLTFFLLCTFRFRLIPPEQQHSLPTHFLSKTCTWLIISTAFRISYA